MQRVKKRREIRWSESVRTNRYEDNTLTGCKTAAAEVLFSVACTLAFLCAAYYMLQEVYQWGSLNSNKVLLLFFVATLTGAVMEVEVPGRKKITVFLRWSVPFAIGLISIGYLRSGDNAEEIRSGLQEMAAVYVNKWNTYYGTEFFVSSGNPEQIEAAMDAVTVFLCVLLLWAVRMRRENTIPVLVPVFVLLLEFLAGDSPEGLGIFVMFAGILSANAIRFSLPDFCPAPGGKKGVLEKKRFAPVLLTCAGILLVCGLAKLAGAPLAEEMVRENSGKAKRLQEEFIDKVSNFSFLEEIEAPKALESLKEVVGTIFVKKDADSAEVTNQEPRYKGVPVLRIQTEERPAENIYLKGFCTGEYEAGVWKRGRKTFEKECRRAGFDSERTAAVLLLSTVGELARKAPAGRLPEEMQQIAATLFYYDSSGTGAYFPYFTEPDGADIYMESDWYVKREKGLEETSFTFWEFQDGSMTDFLKLVAAESPEWEDWYESYVREFYLAVPENMTHVRKTADEIEEKGYQRGLFEEPMDENEMRLLKAYLVVEWLRRNTGYSMELPELPSGADPVEFFLGTSRAGYCMHYASAAVMILRELGVPARYAAGYLVKQSAFLPKYGKYEAIVLDNRAHAWAEVYLDGIGWIPVEVTNGYENPASDGSLTLPVPPLEPPGQPSGTPVPTEVPGNVPGQEPPEDRTELTVTPGVPPDDKTTQTGKQPELTLPEIKQPSAEAKKESLAKKISPVILIFALFFYFIFELLFVPLWRVFKKIAGRVADRRLQQLIQRSGNRQAIRFVNRKIYQRLRRSGKLFKSSLRDAEYEELLKKNYREIQAEDWKRYMELAKAAAFSRSEFTEQETEFCCRIYRKVRQKPFSLFQRD